MWEKVEIGFAFAADWSRIGRAIFQANHNCYTGVSAGKRRQKKTVAIAFYRLLSDWLKIWGELVRPNHKKTYQLMSQPLPCIVNLAVTFRRSQVCCFQKESCDIQDLVLSCRNLSGEGKDKMTLILEESELVSTKAIKIR